MAITDIFKKEAAKKDKDQKIAPKKQQPAAEKKVAGKIADMAVRILAGAHVTEKASNLADDNQYVFRVAKSANKKEIAQAVEEYYQVKIVGVNVVNVPGRRRRNRRGIFFEPGYRKAIVKIKKGQTIEIVPK